MKWITRIGPVALYILACSAYPTLAATIHVPAEYPTIQECIESAVDGDTCLVAPGTYVESIDFLGKAITVRSEAGAEVTAIDGNLEKRRPVAFVRAEIWDSVIDGFTICNGRVRHGGGIYCYSSSPTITNCTISGNKSSFRGGGIICEAGSWPGIKNCIISGNVSKYGGAIYCDDSYPTFINCTISGNTAVVGGGGICSYRNASPMLANCILWGNSAPDGPEIFAVMASAVVVYSDVQGGWPGEGNIDSDPLFMGGGDYHLTFHSPCIDSGTDAGIYTDIRGVVRPQGAGFDLGAYEYPPCEYVSVTVIPMDEGGEERTAGALTVAIEWDESVAVVAGYSPSSMWFGLNDISYPSTWATGRVHISAVREPGSPGEVHIGDVCFRKISSGSTELNETLEVLITTFGDGLEDITEYSRAELTHDASD